MVVFSESTTGIRNGRRKVLALRCKLLEMEMKNRTFKVAI